MLRIQGVCIASAANHPVAPAAFVLPAVTWLSRSRQQCSSRTPSISSKSSNQPPASSHQHPAEVVALRLHGRFLTNPRKAAVSWHSHGIYLQLPAMAPCWACLPAGHPPPTHLVHAKGWHHCPTCTCLVCTAHLRISNVHMPVPLGRIQEAGTFVC